MELERFIASIESEWEPERGFFWMIRQGTFDRAHFNRALSQIASVPTPNGEPLPARLVSLLWNVPIFMEWNRDRVKENRGDMKEFQLCQTKLTNEIERILGVP